MNLVYCNVYHRLKDFRTKNTYSEQLNQHKIDNEYNEISRLIELKNIITQNGINQVQLIAQTKQFLLNVQQNSKSNTETLKNLIEEYKILEQHISLNKPQQIKEKMQQALHNFNYLYKKEKKIKNLDRKYVDILPRIDFSKSYFQQDQSFLKMI